MDESRLCRFSPRMDIELNDDDLVFLNTYNLTAPAFISDMFPDGRCNPVPENHRAAEQEKLTLSVSNGPRPGSRLQHFSYIVLRLSQSLRDKIIAIILSTCRPSNAIRVASAFPSVNLLDYLLHDFFATACIRAEEWIHIPSFGFGTEKPPELLPSMIATGAVATPDKSLQKWGFAIQEELRHFLGRAIENDNSRARDLEAVQGLMVLLEIGHWIFDVTLEFVSMHLHMSLEHIQVFAGSDGREEADDIVPLQEWINESSSRQAIWHAGQLLRDARCVPKHWLQAFLAVAVYHASLVCWAYGLFSASSKPGLPDIQPHIEGARQERDAATKQSFSAGPFRLSPDKSQVIWLDGRESDNVKRFISLGIGSSESPIFLNDTRAVMDMVLSLLQTGRPSLQPPLVENLVQLMARLRDIVQLIVTFNGTFVLRLIRALYLAPPVWHLLPHNLIGLGGTHVLRPDVRDPSLPSHKFSRLIGLDNEDMEHESIGALPTLIPDVLEKHVGCISTNEVRSNKAAKSRNFLTIFSLFLAQFLAALDATIVSVALPTIASQLHSTSAQYAWFASSYMLASTSSTPLWVKFSDIFGRKPTIILANAVFMGGSLISALSPSPTTLIGGRALQGLGGGGIIIMVTIIIGDLFELHERAKYYGFSGVVYGISSGIGPILGAVFTQAIGWQWCFYINLPFDGLSLIILLLFLKVNKPKTTFVRALKTFDWTGSALILAGTLCFLYGLENAAGHHAWSSATSLSLLIVGVALMILFVVNEWYWATSPVFPVRVLANLACFACLMVAAAHTFVFFAYDYFLPLYFQTLLGASPIQSGLYIFALILPLCIMSMSTGPLIKKTGGIRIIIWAGTLLMTLGTGLFIDLPPSRRLAKLVIFQVIAGIGAGLLFVPPMIALQSFLAKEYVAAGTSALSFLRNLLSSLSIVLGSAILEESVGTSGLTNVVGSPVGNNEGNDKSSGTQPQQFLASMKHMWMFYTCIAGLMMVFSFLIVDSKATKAPDQTENESKNQESGFEGVAPVEAPEAQGKS
ncbi:uncharacterized protein Z519_10294 [Cladophialophora bantiana CBS 173.52]|uniref:Major facilitator superfamily (MFS) profile domain-containing protein n=1 Tax=Cladophialophora bantiana (strain ATCC 10958 / CBS 173.52 / CDC B-1940 / NIH 8579) TaxID=1442370 RepID=A0A0D2HD52_CLAB1|nr:uncharacterized protein Z519_10294 [Cladophialophora bantiana CBS 173.52]KIW88810.1 hypothetical protein Z519_10294 [Cladophialophora bantiana CBS 173.52]